MQMGDPAEPFRKVGIPDSRSRELGDFNFSACERAEVEAGGFDFDHNNACGYGADASPSASYGVQSFFELSDAAKAVGTIGSCQASVEAGNDDGQVFFEEGDESGLDWLSPRISFSQDLAMGEFEATNSSRAFTKKGTRQEGTPEHGEPYYGSSSEFEFSSNGVISDGFTHNLKDEMLSADELFSDGKLLPMHLQEKTSAYGVFKTQHNKVGCICVHPKTIELSSNELCACSCKLTLQELHDEVPKSEGAHQKLMPRHLSLELQRPDLSSTMCTSIPLMGASVNNSPCSSPPRGTISHMNAPASKSPDPHKASSKYSFKIKDFFKPKRTSSSSSNPQLTRDNSTASASTCRIPIPPRTFWPFSRSHSAGESKTGTPWPPTLPPRSNSAGESNTSRVATALKTPEVQICKLNKNLNILHGQDVMISAGEAEIDIAKTQMDVGSAKDCINVGSSGQFIEGSKQDSNEEACASTTASHRSSVRPNKGKASGNPIRITRKRYMYSTTDFPRGSPGRHGGASSPLKMNASRIVLRNLERCSTDRKLCRETSGRRTVAYPVAVRVSPVLNVAVYRGGKVSSSGMFGLRRLFSSNKEKDTDKDAVINNWRAGA